MTRIRRHSNKGRPWGPGRACLNSAGPVHGLIIVAVLVFAGLEASAWGQQCKLTQGEFSITRPDPALDGKCWAVPANRVYVPLTGGSFVARISGTQATYVTFPEWLNLKEQLYRHDGFEIAQVGNTVRVAPDPAIERLPAGESTAVLLVADKLSVTMTVEVAQEPEKISRLLMVTPLPPEEYARRIVAAEAEKLAHAREYDAATRLEWRKEVAHMIMDMKELRARSTRIAARKRGAAIALPARYAEENEQVSVLTYAVSLNGDLYLEVTVDNHTTRPLTFERAWLTEGGRDPIEIEMVMDRGVERSDDGIAVVPPDTMIRGVVLVPDSVQSGVEALSIALTGPNGAPGIVAKQFVELYPIPSEVRRRRWMDKHVAVSVQLLGGGFWTDDAAGQDVTDGTTMAGVGVRVQKGMHHNFAFEAGVVGARTGEARFTDISWRGMQGTVERRASFARLHAAGVLRFGDEYVTSTRIGIGVQGARYESTFSDANGPQEGPGNTFEIGLAASVGGGFVARLGESWQLGANLIFTEAFTTNTRSLELDLHLGYSWSLEPRYGSWRQDQGR